MSEPLLVSLPIYDGQVELERLVWLVCGKEWAHFGWEVLLNAQVAQHLESCEAIVSGHICHHSFVECCDLNVACDHQAQLQVCDIVGALDGLPTNHQTRLCATIAQSNLEP